MSAVYCSPFLIEFEPNAWADGRPPIVTSSILAKQRGKCKDNASRMRSRRVALAEGALAAAGFGMRESLRGLESAARQAGSYPLAWKVPVRAGGAASDVTLGAQICAD